MTWRKFNLMHHLISWRNRFGLLSSRRWSLLATLARGWHNEAQLEVKGLDFSSTPDLIESGVFDSTEDAPTSLASSPACTF
jgi:hypothetical protein